MIGTGKNRQTHPGIFKKPESVQVLGRKKKRFGK
jgi:hypothetical protein